MKLKKALVFFMLLILSASFVWAVNYQKTYQMSDEVWVRANRLCVSAGYLGPAPVSPISGAEILNALERLDYSSLSAWQKEEYDYLVSRLSNPAEGVAFTGKNIIFDPQLFIGIEGYAFNNLKDTPVDEFFIPYRDRIPLFYAGIDSYFGDLAYINMQALYKDGLRSFELDEKGNVITVPDGNFYNFSNFSFLMSPVYGGGWSFLNSKDGANYGIQSFQPVKAGGSFGNEFMNLFIGRDRQAFGNGITGNMVIGDNFSFQEMVKLSFFSDIFSYYISLTHFDNVENDQPFSFNGFHQNRLIHRFDINLFNKFRIAVNVGAHMLTDSPFDFRMLNPMMLVHNWRNNKEATEWDPSKQDELNNILGFEFEYAFYPGFIASLQIVIDQFRLSVEKDSQVPSAFGVLGNLKHVAKVGDGYLESWFEAAYTSPYLYLNYKYITDKEGNHIPMYMLDHIVGYSYGSNVPGEESYTGYIYGPDAIVLAAGSEYASFDSWTVGGKLLYMAHGEYGYKSYLDPEKDKDKYESGLNNMDKADPSTPSGVVEHTLSLTVDGSYHILDNLELTGALYASYKWNYHNEKGINRGDVQAAIGLSWTII